MAELSNRRPAETTERFDPTVRAPDNNEPLLDADGNAIAELTVADADELADAGETLAQIAAAERSWRFGHVIVDEAQDLTPMQWRMIARRARGNSMTIVGDLAQRSIGEPGSWADHLPPTLGDFAYEELTINYRSPAEINELAAVVLADLAPELNPPQSIRSSGHQPQVVALDDLGVSLQHLIADTRAAQPTGRLAVIGAEGIERGHSDGSDGDGVHWLTPWQAKGLEFDSVILVEPSRIVAQPHGLSLLFVGLTRTTDRLLIAHRAPLPSVLADYFS